MATVTDIVSATSSVTDLVGVSTSITDLAGTSTSAGDVEVDSALYRSTFLYRSGKITYKGVRNDGH